MEIRAGLTALKNALEDNNINSVAIPALGCGLGGLSWGDVKPLIESAFKDSDKQIVVFEPK